MPNSAVDASSWAELACYPRSTFYPLSDGPSIRNHRITKACFHTCSTGPSRSQAPLCLYAPHAISDRAEGAIALLRYFLGGDRPSQTTRHAGFPARLYGPGLESPTCQGGIPRSARRRLAPALPCLPPILDKPVGNPVQSCSKGSRGLSV